MNICINSTQLEELLNNTEKTTRTYVHINQSIKHKRYVKRDKILNFITK